MAGIRRFNLLLGIIIPIFGFFLMSQNTFAATLSTESFGLYYQETNNSSWTLRRNILYGNTSTQYQSFYYSGKIRDFEWLTPIITFNGNNASIHFETNIVASLYRNTGNPFVNLGYLTIDNCGSYSIAQSTISTAVTPWTSSGRYNYTLTVYGDVVLQNINKTSDDIRCIVTGGNYSFFQAPNDANETRVYFEKNPMSITFSNNINEVLLQTQISQNDTIINQNNISIDQQQAVIDQNNSAYDAIQGQTTSDIQGSENQQTTNLIGILSNFITYLTGRGTSSTCVINLPFPEFLGGNTSVNVCLGKNYYTMNGINYVTVFSHLFVICFFIPLIWILLKLIYNEIRSWTNG